VSISFEVLGQPGADNALLATVNTGQSQHRLLFDCGEGCLNGVPRADVQTMEGLFFSHFHIDHVAGFDSFFRSNWYRADSPVRIFGPPGTRRIMHHRMQGYSWNLVAGATGEIHVSDLAELTRTTSRYLTCEGFAEEHALGEQPFDRVAYRGRDFQVEALAMHHGIPSMAYVVRESDRSNIDMQNLIAQGYSPGPWLKQLKDPTVADETPVEAGGATHSVGALRDQLLAWAPGDSIAYLTDFCLESKAAEANLVEFIQGCKVVICENNFRDADVELARKSFHMTSTEVGRLAAQVNPESFIVFHVSDRYSPEEWKDQLAEVQTQFKAAAFPPHWL